MLTQWEYRLEDAAPDGPEAITAWLNELGHQGWELVSIYQVIYLGRTHGGVYYFKRAIETHPYR